MTAPDPASLRALCVPLPEGGRTVDPVALAGDDGRLFVGRNRVVAAQGTAATLVLPRGLEDDVDLRAVRDWLAAVPMVPTDAAGLSGTDGRRAAPPAPPVMALGAFPFDRRAPAVLAVPARAYFRNPGGPAWLMAVGPAAGPDPATLAAELLSWFRTGSTAAEHEPPSVTVTGVALRPSGEEYARAVAEAVAEIRTGRLRKVVLARAVDLRFGPDPDRPGQVLAPAPSAVVRHLWGADPSFCAFSMPVADGRFVGASPELIVARRGADVTSLPLAGTIALPDAGTAAEAAVERLLASSKDLAEHRLVVDEVAAGLAQCCDDVDVPPAPVVVRLRSDARLGTPVRARVPCATPEPDGCTALELLATLHPTPAVGGVDRATALGRLTALEPVGRGYWAGPVGWVDGTGDGEWVLAIRSATLGDGVARVLAGAGIVAESDPQAELAETTVKLSPVLEALAPGASTLLVPEHPPRPAGRRTTASSMTPPPRTPGPATPARPE